MLHISKIIAISRTKFLILQNPTYIPIQYYLMKRLMINGAGPHALHSVVGCEEYTANDLMYKTLQD